MQILVDIDSEVPLFTQLVDQIKKAISDDHLTPGDALPSIRQLASDLAVNNKTVAKAYKLLERDNVIISKGYRGTFVHEDALKNSSHDISADIQDSLQDAINKCRQLGATDSEIRITFSAAMQS
ncbi:GntR family transcriptional regulator [Temperatibacter marinus]|uniref:GntR family transcriptional regulator n=1 Tax=Temperatibacter marinus TaxID=1456591 RepID=A0AA52EH29_9PROT|nr:GntR family transcriptional regulator [Temperatibacter marinus]WND02389.1 GntR family transcriptional regulator [Temperatibacter marinus]